MTQRGPNLPRAHVARMDWAGLSLRRPSFGRMTFKASGPCQIIIQDSKTAKSERRIQDETLAHNKIGRRGYWPNHIKRAVVLDALLLKDRARQRPTPSIRISGGCRGRIPPLTVQGQSALVCPFDFFFVHEDGRCR